MFLPWIGLEVAILSMFYEYVFVNLHLYPMDHIPLWTYVAQLFFVHSAYGYDRFVDVQNHDTDNQELIDYVHKNTRQITTTLTISILTSIVCLLQNQHTMPLVFPFILSVFYYKNFKKSFPLFKPLFICTLLITSSVIFPSIITENNYSILHDSNAWMPPFANLYSSSNYLDIIDYNIDKANNITTLPVLYGNHTALTVSLMANVFSLISHTNHPKFFKNPVNYFFQAQNLFTGIRLLDQNPMDFRKSRTKMFLQPSPYFKPFFYPVVRSSFLSRCLPKLLV